MCYAVIGRNPFSNDAILTFVLKLETSSNHRSCLRLDGVSISHQVAALDNYIYGTAPDGHEWNHCEKGVSISHQVAALGNYMYGTAPGGYEWNYVAALPASKLLVWKDCSSKVKL